MVCVYVYMYVRMCVYIMCVRTYVYMYVCMYPDAWAFSINYKSADRSTFAMYVLGYICDVPQFLEVALINLTSSIGNICRAIDTLYYRV